MAFRLKTLQKWLLRTAARHDRPRFAAWLLARIEGLVCISKTSNEIQKSTREPTCGQ
jgi:hypothetical protein